MKTEAPDAPAKSLTPMAGSGRQNLFIEIVDDSDVFPWQYTDRDGIQYDTVFQLRLIPDSVDNQWRKELTKRKFEKGQPVEKLDNVEYVKRVLNMAVVNWDVLRLRTPSGVKDVPCELHYKLLLPELLKAAIVRVCVGKELGMAIAQQLETEKNG
jgi:hypothetical protein